MVTWPLQKAFKSLTKDQVLTFGQVLLTAHMQVVKCLSLIGVEVINC